MKMSAPSWFAYRHPFLAGAGAAATMAGLMLRLDYRGWAVLVAAAAVGATVLALWLPRLGPLRRRLEREGESFWPE